MQGRRLAVTKPLRRKRPSASQATLHPEPRRFVTYISFMRPDQRLPVRKTTPRRKDLAAASEEHPGGQQP